MIYRITITQNLFVCAKPVYYTLSNAEKIIFLFRRNQLELKLNHEYKVEKKFFARHIANAMLCVRFVARQKRTVANLLRLWDYFFACSYFNPIGNCSSPLL